MTLTLTQQLPASAIATTTVGGETTVTDVWQEIVTTPSVRDAIIQSVRSLAADCYVTEFLDVLDERDIPLQLRGSAVGVGHGHVHKAIRFADELAGLGSGRSPTEEIYPVARLLEALDDEPVIGIRLDTSFRDRRRDQREAVCRLLGELAKGADVRVAAPIVQQRWLASDHHADLPGTVSPECNARPTDEVPVAALVDDAREELSHDGREVRILRQLSDEAGETLSYHALYQSHDVQDVTVRQAVSTLADLQLVSAFGPNSDRQIELLDAGREYLDVLDSEIGRQQRLPEPVSETGKSSNDSRVTREPTGTPPQQETSTSRRLSSRHDTALLPLWLREPAVAAASDRDVALLDHPIEPLDDRGTRLWSYDHDADRVVVGGEYDNPMQWEVCTALALVDARTWSTVATVDRLEEIDIDTGMIRDARCIGGYSNDAADDPSEFVERLQEWATDLAELTQDLRRGNYDDRNRLRGEISRSAKGLIGTIVDVLDLLDVDVSLVRQLPRLGQFDEGDIADLAENVARTASINSTYGHYSGHRQLFESRDDKRAEASSPSVDAADPTGSVTASQVLIGSSAGDLEDNIVDAVRSPDELHDDAPEIQIPVSVGTARDRPTYAQTVRSILAQKNLDTSRESVALLRALTGSAIDAARALLSGLSTEDLRREIHVDEVRQAVSTLPGKRILPASKPSVGKMMQALLAADRPLSQTELADRAGVSTRSVRTHAGLLEAIDLVATTADGYRAQLSFTDERYDDVLPGYVGEELTTVTDVCWQVAEVLVEPRRLGDPNDPVGGAFFDADPPDALRDWPLIEPWVDVVAALLDHDEQADRTVSFGPAIEQQPVANPSRGVAI